MEASKSNISSDKTDKIAKRDSFEERRILFKNIWQTAVTMDDKEPEITNNKSKVIKTLKLDESIAKTKDKKQRIKNLRTVCTRILDFCNRQDAKDMHRRMSPTRHDPYKNSPFVSDPPKTKKKRFRKKKKINRNCRYVTHSIPISEPDPDAIKLSFDCKEEGPITHRGTRPQRDTSSPAHNRALFIQQFIAERFKLDHSPSISPNLSTKLSDAPRKVVKKKYRKRKKPAALLPSPVPVVAVNSDNGKVPAHGMKKK